MCPVHIEKLDKSYKLVYVVKNLKINDSKYYESDAATTSDAQGDLASNPEIVTHIRKINF